ncbi:MAG: MerR family transcriptional regulator [Chitinophagaceae bacterium]|nr:MerR family transcriptional regulator [Chitinophagaceae bacterium]
MALAQINFAFDENDPGKNSPKKNLSPDAKPKSSRGRKSLKEKSENAGLASVPEDAVLFSKSYYSIGDVSVMFRENASLIRYWTNEFDILQPKKNKKGDRFYRPEDIKNLKHIHHLLRERKYTIEGAKDFLKTNKSAAEKYQMIQSLQKLKSFLLELKNSL